MKKRTFGRMTAMAVVLTLVTTCLLGTSLAKYMTTVTGTGNATVAKWDFKANGKSDTFNIDLVASDEKLAPGSKGTIRLELTNGSEVDATYTISFTAANIPTNLKFYSSDDGANKGTEISVDSGAYTVATDKPIAQNTTTAVSEYIMWEWAYETTGGDATDTTEGIAAQEMTVTVTVTGTQAQP